MVKSSDIGSSLSPVRDEVDGFMMSAEGVVLGGVIGSVVRSSKAVESLGFRALLLETNERQGAHFFFPSWLGLRNDSR